MRREHPERSEQGDTMVQTIIIAPVLFLLIMFVVQFALLAHAQNVAEAAAQEGVTAARRFGATDADGRTKARDSLSSLGPKMLSNQTVTVDRTQTTATVTIRGQALSLIPGFHRNVTETSSGPVERYVAPEQDNP